MKRTLITAAAATVGVVLLAACSGNSSSRTAATGTRTSTAPGSSAAVVPGGTPASGLHNSQDVSFATDMIQHHAQAVRMATMALTNATNPTVKQLAISIGAEQAPEIATMSGWLTGWGQPVPSASTATDGAGTSMPGMSMPGASMPGMMSDAEMTALDQATATAFERLWLAQMRAHHDGAVTMARTELAKGQNPDAKALAQSVITSQSKQIAQLTQLLSTIGG